MFTQLIGIIREFFGKLEDPRKGDNKSYTFQNVCMAAYSLFHMQSSSFLAHQDRLKTQLGRHNGSTLFGFDKLPSDNQVRNLMDTLSPCELSPLFDDLHKEIDLKPFETEGGLAVALDGTEFFSSTKISCPCCLKRAHKSGTRYCHAMLCPAIIHPEQKCALPMAPEFITPQDGAEKQDCEINAAKRWCLQNQLWLQNHKVTLLGDDLFSRAPLIKQIMGYANVRFIFVAKPSSHTYLQNWITDYPQEAFNTYKTTEKMGKKQRIFTYKIFKNIPLNADINAPTVNYFEMVVTNENGKIIYQNSFATNHNITPQNIHSIARIGRNRWKIENEAFNILKTKGYNLEHNFGHGQKNLANIMVCFNLIAFLVHHIAEFYCLYYQKARACFGARVRFFQTLATLTSIQIFESWQHLLDFTSSTFARAEG